MINNLLLNSLYALMATLCFAILFNIRGKNIFFTSLGGAIGWFVYIFTLQHSISKIFAIFLGSIALSIYSEIAARVLKAPVTIFLICAIIPLVPGAGMYYTMLESTKGNIDTSLGIGLETLSLAVTIAVATILVASITKVIMSIKKIKNG
ncbi:threonine/serine exporter family protein [Clostridium sp. MB40-C1]|uniref:threonine/serine exporter family protein n=1 Tax=Clostridium sp. MB40-C1 TaxID=3070996 RepID=UPI0027E0C7B3|nr:threonine/serine exporter family protein [Clostridium sp. MB40-C1]WMJ81279.1 threonine/serine exporter family protein [Clostridium sp. MB40-C1]